MVVLSHMISLVIFLIPSAILSYAPVKVASVFYALKYWNKLSRSTSSLILQALFSCLVHIPSQLPFKAGLLHSNYLLEIVVDLPKNILRAGIGSLWDTWQSVV